MGEAVALLDAAPTPPEFEAHVLKAAEIYNKVQPAKAIPLLHAYLTKNPDSALAHLAMAETAAITNDLGSATQYYQCALELNKAYRDPDFEKKYGIELENAPTALTAKTETVPVANLMKEAAARAEAEEGERLPVSRRRGRRSTPESSAGGCLTTALVAVGVFALCWLMLILVLQSMAGGG